VTYGIYVSTCATSCTAGTFGASTVTCCYYNNCNLVSANGAISALKLKKQSLSRQALFLSILSLSLFLFYDIWINSTLDKKCKTSNEINFSLFFFVFILFP
jgi:hypothetical protein